jgi:hypothetical protein
MEHPNLDGLNEDELIKIADNYRLFSMYAGRKANAMILRKNGNIVDAIKQENWCEKIYSQLPEEMKW